MEPVVIEQLVTRIFDLLAEKLGAKGKTLEKRLLYVSRKLPGRVRKAGQALVEAQSMAESPNLAMKIDSEALSASYDVISKHLSEIDSAAERSRKRYNLFAAIAAQVLLVAAAIFAVLMWRGYV